MTEEESCPPPPSPLEQLSLKTKQLLEVCRAAEDEDCFRTLAVSFNELDRNDIQARMTQEIIARTLLTECSYQHGVFQVLKACGVVMTISTCSSVLKEMASTTAHAREGEENSPKGITTQTVVENCWKTIQQMLLNTKQTLEYATDDCANEDDHDVSTATTKSIAIANHVECQEFVTKSVLLLPQNLANACHATKLQMPLHATIHYFYPRLVYVACQKYYKNGAKHKSTVLYVKTLMQHLLQTRRSEFVARGMFTFLESLSLSSPQEASSKDFSSLFEMLQLSAEDTATLVFMFLQHMDSIESNKKSNAMTQLLYVCQSLFRASSVEYQEMIVERLVFSKHSLTPGTECRWSQWVVQVILTPIDQDDKCMSSFLAHITTIAERWSEWSFLQHVDGRQQHNVSLFLWECLKTINSASSSTPTISLQDQHDLTLAIMQGVSRRLESTLKVTRQDGMRIATELAKGLGQDIQFDELEDINHDGEKVGCGKNNATTEKQGDESEGDMQNVFKEAPADNTEGDDDDVVSVEWDDELIPYDLNDDEEDLAETPKPLQLLEALDYLRTGENHDHAYTRHQAALNALPDLIRSRPHDLLDAAVSIALQLLRMENKFNMDDFHQKRQKSVVALLVEEPPSVGSSLIEQLFEDGGLGDRLNILSGLQVAALELSGHHEPTLEDKNTAENLTPQLLRDAGAETKSLFLKQGTCILSKTRMKRSRPNPKIFKNKFVPVAPMWFYSMIAGFLRHKENEVIWSGSTGSIFLAHFFRCLATIVECSGFHASQVLAFDLLDLVWDFRIADVPEVRLSVLVAVATSIAMLPEERIFAILHQEDSTLLKQISDMSGNDPDKQCRTLSLTIAKSIYHVIQNSTA
jgi:hypothetical protein